MTHFLKNTPVFNGSTKLPKFLVQVIDKAGDTSMVEVFAKNEKEAKQFPAFLQITATGIVFPIVETV